MRLLGIDLAHLGALQELPRHHRDPFDRLIIATAIAEQVPVISYDGMFDRYGVARVG